MIITKFEHACLLLDNGKHRLIIDPGSFTNLPDNLTNLVCAVITEEHVDHYNLENIKKILAQNPEITILSTKTVAEQLKEVGINCQAVTRELKQQAQSFTLKLKETDHAEIYKSSPCRVLTIQVDDFLYYPSDSFTTTESSVEVLALPTSGPWHKISHSIDLANQVNSNSILATHNGLYNNTGNIVANNFTSSNITDKNREFVFLEVGESKKF